MANKSDSECADTAQSGKDYVKANQQSAELPLHSSRPLKQKFCVNANVSSATWMADLIRALRWRRVMWQTWFIVVRPIGCIAIILWNDNWGSSWWWNEHSLHRQDLWRLFLLLVWQLHTAQMLKARSNQLSRVLQHLINLTLYLLRVPMLWKTSILVPVLKISHDNRGCSQHISGHWCTHHWTCCS